MVTLILPRTQMYVLSKDHLPMDVEFVLYDSLEVGILIAPFFKYLI